MKEQKKQRSLFVKCLAGSCLLHGIALFLFYKYPPTWNGSFVSLFNHSSQPELVPYEAEETEAAVEEKNEMLKEIFEEIAAALPGMQKPLDLEESEAKETLLPSSEKLPQLAALKIEKELRLAPAEAIAPPQNISYPSIPDQYEGDLLVEELGLLPTPDVQFQKGVPQERVDELSLSAAPLENEDPALSFASQAQAEEPSISKSDGMNLCKTLPEVALPPENLPSPSMNKEDFLVGAEETTTSPLLVPNSQSNTPEPWENRSLQKNAAMRAYNSYGLPEGPAVVDWQTDFSLTVQMLPKKEDEPYRFALTLQPLADFSGERVKQNFYFLVDRSNSIDKHRYAVFKKGVLKALASLQEGDTFNITIFDNKIVKLREKNLPVTSKSLALAEEFLEKEGHGGLFAAADLYTYLEKLVPSSPVEGELHTAILLSDGKTSLSPKKQQKTIKQWLAKNEGKVALYAAAAGQNNNLVLLDLLSSESGGELMYSDTQSAFPRKLAKLILDLRDPIAKEISLRTLSKNRDAKITIYPASHHLPALRNRKAFMVFGTAEELSDFRLVIEGMHEDKILHIEKEISFEEAHKGNRSLEKRFEALKASVCYKRFLESGKEEELENAKKLLASSCGEIAFE